MSLRDAVKNLRGVAKKFDAAKFDFKATEVAAFVEKIDATGLNVQPPADLVKALTEKFLRGEENFTRRELRHLPFIIYDANVSFDGVQKIWRLINLSDTRHLRAVINVYLSRHDDSAKTAFLRQRLKLLHKEAAGNSTRLKKIFAAREYFFADERLSNTAKLFARTANIDAALNELGLTKFFKASNFIQLALKEFFRTNNLDAQLKILGELDDDFVTYANIFPAVADALIQTVDANANVGKKTCMEIFYRRLGDPRFGSGKIDWQKVSDESREIFCHWLAEDDLEIFFEIVAQTSNDKQWRYREEFWRGYLPDITNTWVYFAGNAQNIAAGLSNRNYGTLTNGGGNQAVFVFQIGEYIFSEWSNVGKVRAHKASLENFFFGRQTPIDGKFFTNAKFFTRDWSHLSPQTNFWQREVSAWIRRHC